MKRYLFFNVFLATLILGIGYYSWVVAPSVLFIIGVILLVYAIGHLLYNLAVSELAYFSHYVVSYSTVQIIAAVVCFKLTTSRITYEADFIPILFYGIVVFMSARLAGEYIRHEAQRFRMDSAVHDKTRVYRKLLKVSGVLFIVYAAVSALNYLSKHENVSNYEFLSIFNFDFDHRKLILLPTVFLVISVALFITRTIHIYKNNK